MVVVAVIVVAVIAAGSATHVLIVGSITIQSANMTMYKIQPSQTCARTHVVSYRLLLLLLLLLLLRFVNAISFLEYVVNEEAEVK